MKVVFLYKNENVEFLPIIETLANYMVNRKENIEIKIYNENNYENIKEDATIILTNTFNNFLELYCLTRNKRRVMVFTNNTNENFIRMLLMIVKHISYIRCESVYFKSSSDFKKYLIKNNRRLYNNIINFVNFVEKVEYK